MHNGALVDEKLDSQGNISLHTIAFEIPKPKNEADFERMCKLVYGAVFHDPRPKINGRKGQSQWGVDIYVNDSADSGRIGIQCKKYCLTSLTLKNVKEEVEKADKAKLPIKLLLIATTSESDSKLLLEVMKLSDDRKSKGLFEVEVEFWDEIEYHIAENPFLQNHYAPHSPGAAYHRQERSMEVLTSITTETHGMVATLQSSLPTGRTESVNKMITEQLDRTNEIIKTGHYRAALEHIDSIGKDLKPFDEHQKARWHLQRAFCLWFSRDNVDEAAALFLKAAELYPDDEKMAAAKVRGLMLQKNMADAIEAGKAASDRFPASIQVWLAHANARMASGERISRQDVPAAFRDEPDALQFAAISAQEYGDVSTAAELASKAVEKPAAGFFTRSTFLRLALDDCIRDPVLAQFGLIPASKLERLKKAAESFQPRKERLWDVESDAVADDAVHLGFAYLLMGNHGVALDIAREGRAAHIETGDLLRVEMQALAMSGKEDEALDLAKANLDKISPEAMTIAGELAANRADPDLVLKISDAAKERSPGNSFAADYLTALRWGALAKAKRRDEVLAEIRQARPTMDESLILRCSAARVYKWAGMLIEASDEATAAAKLIGPNASSADKLHVADLLIHFEMWSKAAALYEELITGAGNGPSEVHARLLECHVEAGNRAKAHAMLTRMPGGWTEHDETRRIAINFGSKVGDWPFLLPLARKSVEKHPKEAGSWLFLLQVLIRTAEPEAFLQELRTVPDDLSGSIRDLAVLGSTESKMGEVRRGMARLYKLVRSSNSDPEALAAYLINFLMAKLPLEEVKAVSAGTFVEFEDCETGALDGVCIDPPEAGTLPRADGFFSAGDADVAAFMGAQPGQEVSIPMAAGGERKVKVTALHSAYQHLAASAQERAHRFQGLPHLWAVSMGQTGDAEKDLAKMHEMLKRSSEANARLLDAYSGGLTISLLAKAMGRSPIEICAGWQASGPPLFVGAGAHSERDEAMALLAQKEMTVVVDSTALAELALFGALKALDALPKILMSTATKETIDAFLHEVENDESVGTAFDNDGRLGFIEFDDSRKQTRLEFAKALADVVSRCEVAPAYVDIDATGETGEFAELLANEEREALLLAKERNAILLTLDGRLQTAAKQMFGVSGVWPQVLVLRAMQTGDISKRDAAEFNAREFMSNRDFVSIRSDDIMWMATQGDQWLQQSFARLRSYLSASSTERDSSFAIVLEFLGSIVRSHMQVGAFAALLSYFSEAFYSRKDCDLYTDVKLFDVAKKITFDAAPTAHLLEAANVVRDQEIKARLRLFASAIRAGRERARESAPPAPLRIRVLHCSALPWLIVDISSEGDRTDLKARPGDAQADPQDSQPSQGQSSGSFG